MVERKFLSWRIKVKVRKKGFRMQRYIFEIRKGKKILGYEIKIGEMGFNQSFLYKDYHDPRFVAEAICLNNKEIDKFINHRSKWRKPYNRKKDYNLNLDKCFDEIKVKYNISSFPVKLFNKKIIEIDYNRTHYIKYFIAECPICHNHLNIQVSRIQSHSGICNRCSRISKEPIKIKKDYKSINKTKVPRYKISTQITSQNNNRTYHIFTCNKNIYEDGSNNKINIEKEIEKFTYYVKYLRDKFIKEYNLKYPLSLSLNEFNTIKQNYKPEYDKDLSIKIDYNGLKYCNKIRKQQHIFKAKILGFGNNKDNGNKTILFEAVEYVGIDNFRDHMWTEFRKDLDLPIGTTIKFKGEIYDYERNYLGKKEEDKNGQSIKIIDLLEIDTSTRKRVKLYE